MLLLTAAVLLVGVLCVVDLILSFGLIRRLREDTRTVMTLAGRVALLENAPGSAAPTLLPNLAPDTVATRTVSTSAPVGRPVDAFTANTVDGEPVSRETLAPNTFVIFLAADCPSCRGHVPEVAGWARDHDRDKVIVIIDAMVADPAPMAAALREVAMVIVEPNGPVVTNAFGVSAFPSYCVVDRGEVIVSSMGVPTPSASVAHS